MGFVVPKIHRKDGEFVLFSPMFNVLKQSRKKWGELPIVLVTNIHREKKSGKTKLFLVIVVKKTNKREGGNKTPPSGYS